MPELESSLVDRVLIHVRIVTFLVFMVFTLIVFFIGLMFSFGIHGQPQMFILPVIGALISGIALLGGSSRRDGSSRGFPFLYAILMLLGLATSGYYYYLVWFYLGISPTSILALFLWLITVAIPAIFLIEMFRSFRGSSVGSKSSDKQDSETDTVE